jgi:hypothetical protein
MNIALWVAQVLLLLMFLFAGGTKLVWPPEMLEGPFPLPIAFIRILGVAEVLGAVAMILPGLLRIKPGLTPLAAAGLAVIMVGAVVITATTMSPILSLIPLVLGLLAAFVAYGRWRLAPLPDRSKAGAVAQGRARLATDS